MGGGYWAGLQGLFWASYSAWGAMEIWVIGRDRLRRAKGERADRGSFWGLVAGLGGGIFLGIEATYVLPRLQMPGPRAPIILAGVALMWAGIGFRMWAILTLGRFFRATVVVQDEHRLITTGPYRWLRHPSYSGGLMTLTGLGVALGNWASLAFVLSGALLGYVWRIRVEEQALARNFGDAYAQFRKDRWGLVPFVW